MTAKGSNTSRRAARPGEPKAGGQRRSAPGAKAVRPGAMSPRRPLLLGSIAAALIVSGLWRLGDGGLMLARAAGSASEPVAPTVSAAPEAAACEAPPDAAALLAELREREANVASREAAQTERQKVLDEAGQQIDARLAELGAAEERLSKTIAQADAGAEGDVDRLTAMYEAMKPKDAAGLFQEMAPDFAAGFLGRMQPATAGAVLAAMDPKKAYTVSVVLAGRNAAAPRQ